MVFKWCSISSIHSFLFSGYLRTKLGLFLGGKPKGTTPFVLSRLLLALLKVTNWFEKVKALTPKQNAPKLLVFSVPGY